MVNAGDIYERDGVVIQIVEVNQLRDPRGGRMLMVSYRLKHGNFVSPVAHFWVRRWQNPEEIINQIVDNYLRQRGG